MLLNEDEFLSFDVYFASICSMQFHPGAGAKEHKALSVKECKDCALEMVSERRKLLEASQANLNEQERS